MESNKTTIVPKNIQALPGPSSKRISALNHFKSVILLWALLRSCQFLTCSKNSEQKRYSENSLNFIYTGHC